jgi:hypothetical protein
MPLQPSTEKLLDILKELNCCPIPSICPYYVLGWQQRMHADEKLIDHYGFGWTRGSRRHLDQVWILGFKWLSMPRTTAEIRTLVSLRCQCTPEDSSDSVHQAGAQALAQDAALGQPIVSQPFCVVAKFWLKPLKYLRLKYKSHRRVTKLYKIVDREDWPSSIQDVLPHGPDDTIRGLLQWFRADLDLNTIAIFCESVNRLLDLCAPYILPSLIACWPFCVRLVACMDSAISFRRSDEFLETENHAEACFYSLRASSRLLADIVLEYANRTQRDFFMKPRAENIRQKIISSMDLLDEFKTNIDFCSLFEHICDLEERLDVLCTAIWTVITPTSEIEAGKYPIYEGDNTSVIPFQYPPWYSFIKCLIDLENCQRCQRPGCSQFLVHRHALRYCTGCRRVVYCSVHCQKLAWKHHTAPHRQICGVIRSLCIQLDLPRHRIVKKLPHAPVDKAYLPAARTVIKHLDLLAKADMKARSKNIIIVSLQVSLNGIYQGLNRRRNGKTTCRGAKCFRNGRVHLDSCI